VFDVVFRSNVNTGAKTAELDAVLVARTAHRRVQLASVLHPRSVLCVFDAVYLFSESNALKNIGSSVVLLVRIARRRVLRVAMTHGSLKSRVRYPVQVGYA